MENQKNKKKKKVLMPFGLRNKLIAAISMLLVSSIMMVSSTYAWFTLSTAPEVTGISTSVGANGNLEIALLNKDTYGTPANISSAVGDSSAKQAVTKANITWGNLVDLKDASYGLTNIKLMPARLLANNGTIANTGSPIAVAKYGTDGRVTELDSGTVSGIYHTTGIDDGAVAAEKKDSATGFYANDGKGVRALGTASGMSQQQLAYRNAQGYIATYTAQAKNYAEQSLTLYGSDLASIAVKHVNTAEGAEEKYTLADVTAINNMLDMLTNAKTALEKALMYSVLGENASKSGSAEAYKAVQDAIAEENATLATVKAAGTATLGSAFNTAEATFETITIPAKIDTTGKTEFSWADISAVVTKLVDTNHMTLNGVALSDVKDQIQKIVDDILAGKGITVTADSESGIYATIAELTGNYSAQVTIKEVTYGSFSAKNAKATLTTNVTGEPQLPAELSAVIVLGAPAKAAGEENPITDTYAYAIDLAFRTNASNAKLMLQVEAAQRIYDGSNVQDTQGSGSNLTFTVGGDMTADAAKKLAKNIYVVFADNTGKVLSVAGLVTDGDGWSTTGTANEYKANLVMKAYSFDEEGKINVTGDATGDKVGVITELTQNEAKVITAYVYLNGDFVDNSAVAANAAASMVGTLNLQFSTDQKLVPMDYTPLQQSGSTTPNP